MSKRTRKALSVFIPLMVLVLACTCLPNGNGGGGGDETPPPLPPANVLFEDDFGSSGSGWETGDYDGGNVGYKNGVYSVTSYDGRMWGLANQSFSDVVIEVDATQVSAPANDNNAYGIVCREQGDEGGSGYYLMISGDGNYTIAKIVNGDVEYLVEWTTSSAIRQGNATNHIRAICDGSNLVLFANGQRLASANDSSYTSGDIALTATSLEDDESTEIHFDNLVVRKP